MPEIIWAKRSIVNENGINETIYVCYQVFYDCKSDEFVTSNNGMDSHQEVQNQMKKHRNNPNQKFKQQIQNWHWQ